MQRIRLPRVRTSVWIQAIYLWYFAAVGCLVPYIALYYQKLALNGGQIGVLMAIMPLGTACLAPVWGALADKFSVHRLVLRSALVLAALAALLLSQVTHFALILLSIAVIAGAIASIPTLLDGYALTLSERQGRPYGPLRVWGTIGFMLGSWSIGSWMGTSVSNVFLIAYAASLLFACAATIRIPSIRAQSSQPLHHGIAALLRDRTVVVLLLTAFLVTLNMSAMTNFMGIYLSEIGGTVQLIGIASAVAALTEIPMLLFGQRLLDRFSSQRLLLFAIAMFALRYALYGLPPQPNWVLAVQLLHGLSFGAYFLASVTLIHQLAGPERAATGQGLLSSTSFGFGSISGSLLGGLLLDRVGVIGIFRLATGGMVLAFVVYLVGLRLVTAAAPRTPPTLIPIQDHQG